MKEIIGTIFALIVLLSLFILGYNYVFNTDKMLKKLYSHKTKFDVIADFFNISREPRLSWIRFGGWIAMIISVIGHFIRNTAQAGVSAEKEVKIYQGTQK